MAQSRNVVRYADDPPPPPTSSSVSRLFRRPLPYGQMPVAVSPRRASLASASAEPRYLDRPLTAPCLW